MEVSTILQHFHTNSTISEEVVSLILDDDNNLCSKLIYHFYINKDRDFALSLLNKFISIRENPDGEMPAENLMLACYILGQHQQIEDCLKIWEAKNVDFDTYCGLDIQLVPFAGVSETMAYLKNQNSPESIKALEYVEGCSECGDFDNLDEYFSKNKLPWFI